LRGGLVSQTGEDKKRRRRKWFVVTVEERERICVSHALHVSGNGLLPTTVGVFLIFVIWRVGFSEAEEEEKKKGFFWKKL
jgi:hypothetical protein